jgi:hypothetical protein
MAGYDQRVLSARMARERQTIAVMIGLYFKFDLVASIVWLTINEQPVGNVLRQASPVDRC